MNASDISFSKSSKEISMETSILQKLVNWKEELERFALSGEITNIDELSSSMLDRALEITLDVLGDVVKQLNENIRAQKASRKAAGLVIKEKDIERTILLRIGSFTFKRDYFYDKGSESYCFPMDEILGIEKRTRVSDGIRADLVNGATWKSYERSSTLVSGHKVSKQTVRNSVLQLEVPEKEIEEKKRKIEEIHIYADEDHVHMQKPGKVRGKKNQIVPIVTVTEGTETVSQRRNRTINPMHFVDEEFNVKRLWESVDGYINQAYDGETLKKIYLHGDGGKWISSGLEDRSDVTKVMDEFHFGKRTKEISRLFPCQNMGLRIRSAIRKGFSGFDEMMQELLGMVCGQEAESKVKEYGAHVANHYEAIRNRLTLEIPGSCTEGLVSSLLSERFSRNPMGWSKAGLGKLSKARIYVKNGGKIEGSDFRSGTPKRYSTYVEEERRKLLEGKYDWSFYEPEQYIFDGNSGTQRAIRNLGKFERIS